MKAGHCLFIFFFPAGKPDRRKKPSGCKRIQIFPCADVRRTGPQKFHFKYDILIFHGVSRLPPNGMKSSRGYHKNITFFSRICFHAKLDFSSPLFHINQFHLLMPVKNYRRKIQGNGTGINVKGEKSAAMLFCLFIPFFYFFFSF